MTCCTAPARAALRICLSVPFIYLFATEKFLPGRLTPTTSYSETIRQTILRLGERFRKTSWKPAGTPLKSHPTG